MLDLGSGPGWTAGLLAAFGALVTSAEADPGLARQVRARLEGYRPPVAVLCTDAMAGHAAGGPYDALPCGFAVRGHIAGAWIAQVRPAVSRTSAQRSETEKRVRPAIRLARTEY